MKIALIVSLIVAILSTSLAIADLTSKYTPEADRLKLEQLLQEIMERGND